MLRFTTHFALEGFLLLETAESDKNPIIENHNLPRCKKQELCQDVINGRLEDKEKLVRSFLKRLANVRQHIHEEARESIDP